MSSISYAITVCSERKELEKLLNQLFKYIRKEDEIIVQFDFQNGTDEVRSYLEKTSVECAINKIDFHRIFIPLNNDFATFKNELKRHCVKDYIFQIDADELCHENLLKNLPLVLENNNVDVIIIPRENYVEGITEEDIKKWGWRIDEKNRINYPDIQTRILKNKPGIVWKNRVHEQVIGYQTLTSLPYDVEGWCLLHYKTIDKQRKQNEFYAKI